MLIAWLHRRRSLAGYSPWSHKESDTTERLSKYLLRISYIIAMHNTVCDENKKKISETQALPFTDKTNA